MEEDEVAWWGRQMVGAVDWVHGQGYAHRYVKRLPILTSGTSSRTTFCFIVMGSSGSQTLGLPLLSVEVVSLADTVCSQLGLLIMWLRKSSSSPRMS